jgi:sugar phosphate isomerase/epimerase
MIPMNRWCRLAILTDEVSQELDDVIRFAREFKLDGIELRSLAGKAFKDLTISEIGTITSKCRDNGLTISGCATPVFKCDIDDPTAIAEHVDLFRRSLDAAKTADCTMVRVFTFLRRGHPTSPSDLERAASHFHSLIEAANGSGICIGVENEASCLVGTGAETREFLRHLPDSPQLGVVWDPCNVVYLDGTNDPVHDDYPLIANRVSHVHLKDASRNGDKAAQRCVELGTGQIDFPAQLSALKAGGYRDWITLETHWRSVPLDDEIQHLPAGYAFSAHAEPASRICMGHLQSWIAAA